MCSPMKKNPDMMDLDERHSPSDAPVIKAVAPLACEKPIQSEWGSRLNVTNIVKLTDS